MVAKKKRTIRKKKKNQVQVPFPVVLANVLVLVAVLGLSYMWLCARCDALGREIKGKEAELAAAQKRFNNEQERWSMMTSPSNLRQAIRKFNLDMQMPRESQIVKLGPWDASGRTAQADTRSYMRQ
ncbi:MAG: hypothetical protein JXR25_10310 [Pontiellaceae bacterium]|nr:hypothetical protein [Pontiellaceae bacterium]MBN2785211.1 hypothetical protein [Pontiellaceae bacterium]